MTVDSNPSIVIEEPCVTANILHTVSAESDTFLLKSMKTISSESIVLEKLATCGLLLISSR